MDDETNPNPFDEGDQKSRISKITLLGATFIMICISFIFAFIGFQPDQLSLSDRYFPSSTPTATSTSTPTPTPTPNLAATAQVLKVQATHLSSQWPKLISDTFDTNAKNWDVGEDNGELGDVFRELRNGGYRWTVTANEGFVTWERLDTKDLGDFTLSVDAREVKNVRIAEHGLIFREDRNGNFYYFGINYNGEFFVQINYMDEWDDLITPISSNIIRSVGFNHLAVVAQGAHFSFFINDEFVAEVTDSRIKTGTTAMAVSMIRAEDKGVFEFDNIELRAP